MSATTLRKRNPELIERIEYAINCEIDKTEPTLQLSDLLLSYGVEQYEFDKTPACRIEYILDILDASAKDTIYDLGSGYGTVPIIGSTLCDAAFVGVELVKERHLAASRVRDYLALDNIELANAHVLDIDLRRGDKFYIFSPFFHSTLEKICARLEAIAETKPVRIVSISQSSLFLESLDWLEKCSTPVFAGRSTAFDFNICLFESRS